MVATDGAERARDKLEEKSGLELRVGPT